MIDYPKIYAFCEVANCLSFTEAANRLYTTQSSLSKSIASLEKTIGCQLFIRSNRNVTLTPAGEYLHAYFRKNLEDMQMAVGRAAEINEGIRGHLTIGIYGLHGIVKDITDIFLNFCRENPMYSFEFIPMTMKETRDSLISKKIDAVISKQQDVSFIPDCAYRVFSSCNLVAIARSEHPLFEKYEAPTLSDLKDYGFAIVSQTFSLYTYKMAIKACEDNGFAPKIMALEHSLFGMMMHIAASDYVGIIDEYDCRNRDVLKQIPINNSPLVHTVLAWNKGDMSEHLQKFIEYLDSNPQRSYASGV